MARRRLIPAIEDLRIEIDLAGPLDRATLRVDANLLEDLAPLMDRR
jgi:hypothetical protein